MAKTKKGEWVEVTDFKLTEQEMYYLLAVITATLLSGEKLSKENKASKH